MRLHSVPALVIALACALVATSTFSRAAPTGRPAEDAAAQVQRERAEQASVWERINQLNPFGGTDKAVVIAPGGGTHAAKDPFADPTTGAAAATGSPGSLGSMEQLHRLLSNPTTQAILKQFSNPVFAKAVDQVIYSPHRMDLLYAELGWMFFMLVLRAWRMAYPGKWYKRLWTRTWTFWVYLGGASIGIPWIVLGEPYFKTMVGIVEVVSELVRKS